MIPEIQHLKNVIEGKPDLPRWRRWFEEHKRALEQVLTPGQLLRLKHRPMTEIPAILKERGISFVPSETYEWIDVRSNSGRCRDCGALVQTERCGDLWVWCPNGCFELEAHFPPRRDDGSA
jgi:hypothetical protein